MNKIEQSLIDVTFELLYKNGYCATNLNDILKTAQTTKGAMYYHFASKKELVLASMEFYLEKMLQYHWVEPLQNSKEPIETLIEQIIRYKEMYYDEESFLEIKHGYPLSNFILDMSDKEEVFFEYLEDISTRWTEAIEQALRQAQKNRQTHTTFEAKEQALFIMGSIGGAITMAKVTNDKKVLDTSINVLITYLKAL
ncbi:MAG: TetR/AcrR family transcriptional regulator [Sulfurovum sp.]|nr:TetR/AcrR family transcriptional regulator [Sulfurovum sp.]